MTVEDMLENFTEPVFASRVFVGRAGYVGDHSPYPDAAAAIEALGDCEVSSWCLGYDTISDDPAIYISVIA